MSTSETIELSRDGRGVASLRLNRPEKRNTLNREMISELRAALAALDGDESVRVVVVSGRGSVFCAGADLAWMQQLASNDRAQRIAQAGELGALLAELNRLSKPVIACVHGGAYGGGIGIMAACDVVVAASDARFALTEVRLGLVPALIGPFVVAKIGEAAARHLILSARTFDANTAHRIGLATVVAASTADLDASVEDEVGQFLAGAPQAIGAAKTLIRRLANSSLQAGPETREILARQLETEEAELGLSAFLTGELPPWQDRSSKDR